MKIEALLSTFSELGLSSKEVEFLQVLIKHQKMTLPQVVKLTRITKPTAYRICKGLQEKGLVRTDHKKYQQTISICSAHDLLEFAGKKQRRIRKVELKIKNQMKDIQRYLRHPLAVPEIKQYAGKEGYIEIADETLEKEGSELLYCGDLDDIYRVITPEYDQQSYMPERIKKSILLKMLVSLSPATRKLKEHDERMLRETRFIEQKEFLSASFLISQDRIYFLSNSEEAVAIKITSSSISNMFRHIFNQFWQNAKSSNSGTAAS